MKRRLFLKIMPYESRYFSVDLSEDGTVQSSDTGQIAAVDFSMAVRYAKSILKSGKTQGFVGNYRYLVSDDADKVQIVFLDCGRTLSGFWRFLVISVWVAAFGLVAVFILIFLFSKRISPDHHPCKCIQRVRGRGRSASGFHCSR